MRCAAAGLPRVRLRRWPGDSRPPARAGQPPLPASSAPRSDRDARTRARAGPNHGCAPSFPAKHADLRLAPNASAAPFGLSAIARAPAASRRSAAVLSTRIAAVAAPAPRRCDPGARRDPPSQMADPCGTVRAQQRARTGSADAAGESGKLASYHHRGAGEHQQRDHPVLHGQPRAHPAPRASAMRYVANAASQASANR